MLLLLHLNSLTGFGTGNQFLCNCGGRSPFQFGESTTFWALLPSDDCFCLFGKEPSENAPCLDAATARNPKNSYRLNSHITLYSPSSSPTEGRSHETQTRAGEGCGARGQGS